MQNVNMDIKTAAEILTSQMDNACFSPAFRAALRIAAEHLSDEAEKQLGKCKYYSSGRCMGQKGMPECTPNYGYCPMKKV
jgi:hypothetical protein